jgi:hypothetical protein
MPNGKPGDHPYTDIVIHGRDVYLSDDKTQRKLADLLELSLQVGDGGNREGGISWGCLTPPLLHRRSDMPCPKITSSS